MSESHTSHRFLCTTPGSKLLSSHFHKAVLCTKQPQCYSGERGSRSVSDPGLYLGLLHGSSLSSTQVAIRRKEALTQATVWMNLESISPSERS